MARIKFKLTKDHIILVKSLHYEYDADTLICDFNITGNKYVDIETVLKGMIPNDELAEKSFEYNDDVKLYYDKLLSELPDALNIIHQHLIAEPSNYVRLSYQNNWELEK